MLDLHVKKTLGTLVHVALLESKLDGQVHGSIGGLTTHVNLASKITPLVDNMAVGREANNAQHQARKDKTLHLGTRTINCNTIEANERSTSQQPDDQERGATFYYYTYIATLITVRPRSGSNPPGFHHRFGKTGRTAFDGSPRSLCLTRVCSVTWMEMQSLRQM